MEPPKAYPITGVLSQVLELVVGKQDMDSLGHLNNATYVSYLERGRMDFYRRIGLKLEPQRGPRLGTVVVNMDINFRSECFAGDVLRIHTRAFNRGTRSYMLEQSITHEQRGVVCDARVTNVIMELGNRTVVDIPPALARLYPAGGNQQNS